MTPQEIRFAALRELGVVAVDESPSAEQGTAAEEKYASLHAQLLRDGLARWALTEDVPAYAEQSVVWMLAYLCAVSEGFGSPPAKKEELQPLGSLGMPHPSLGERRLRAMNGRKYVNQPAQSEYY